MKVTDPDMIGRDARPITGRVAIIKTTLYELIEAIGDVIETGEEKFIPEILLDLIDSGKITISGNLYYL
jgi:hypothetical protein